MSKEPVIDPVVPEDVLPVSSNRTQCRADQSLSFLLLFYISGSKKMILLICLFKFSFEHVLLVDLYFMLFTNSDIIYPLAFEFKTFDLCFIKSAAPADVVCPPKKKTTTFRTVAELQAALAEKGKARRLHEANLKSKSEKVRSLFDF